MSCPLLPVITRLFWLVYLILILIFLLQLPLQGQLSRSPSTPPPGRFMTSTISKDGMSLSWRDLVGHVCCSFLWSRAGLTHLDEQELSPSAELCCHRWQRCWHVHPLRCIAQETSRDCVNLIIALATDGWLHNQRNYKTHREQTQEEKPDQWYLKALKQV